MLIHRWKITRHRFILGVVIASLIISSVPPILPIASAIKCPDGSTANSEADCPKTKAKTATSVNFEDKGLSFERINRTTIKIGDAYFYSNDPTKEANNEYTAVGLDCPAKLTYTPYVPATEYSAGSDESWSIGWKKKLESQSGCNGAEITTVRTDNPKNNGENERYYTIFYLDGDKVNSVLNNNTTTFTKKGNFNGNDTYIEDGKQPLDCPSIIRNSGGQWVYIPMHKIDKAEDGSDQYRGLLSKITGVAEGDFACNPVGNGPDKDPSFTRFGLPGSYYDRGTTHKNDVTSNFGFKGADIYGAVLLGGVLGKGAAGLAANGPLAGGKEVGNGQGATTEPSGSTEGKTTCGIAGIGWIVCPVMTFVSSLNDTMYGFIAGMLVVEPGLFDTSNTGPYVAWQQFQGIANILFVVAFLVIIYSQITSVGISNYGVKKLLPKLIVVAILVNISYFMCQLAVDVSNILGVGLKSMFDSMAAGDIGKAVTNTHGWTAVVGGIIAGVGGAALLLLAVSVPVLVSAFLALSMIILILIARKAIIVLLIVVSPIAFVLYLLPNTEHLFKKWWKLFSSLLMLYPVIAVVFGASSLAATILMGLPGEANKIVALGASAIPLFVVPGMLKGALAATGKLGAKMQGWGDKATSGVGNAIKNRSQLGTTWQEARKHKQQQHAIGMARKRGTGLSRVVGRVGGGRGYNEKARLRASSLENEEYENDVKAADQALLGRSYQEKENIANGVTSASEAERDAAVRFMMSSGNQNERNGVLASTASMTARQRRSAVGGARAKGDTGVYGSSTLGAIEEGRFSHRGADGSVDVAAQLNAGTVQRIETGEVTPETFTRDTYTATYIANQVQHATPQAQVEFAQTLDSYMATEQGQKVASATRNEATRVINTATAPQPAQPPQPGTP